MATAVLSPTQPARRVTSIELPERLPDGASAWAIYTPERGTGRGILHGVRCSKATAERLVNQLNEENAQFGGLLFFIEAVTISPIPGAVTYRARRLAPATEGGAL